MLHEGLVTARGTRSVSVRCVFRAVRSNIPEVKHFEVVFASNSAGSTESEMNKQTQYKTFPKTLLFSGRSARVFLLLEYSF